MDSKIKPTGYNSLQEGVIASSAISTAQQVTDTDPNLVDKNDASDSTESMSSDDFEKWLEHPGHKFQNIPTIHITEAEIISNCDKDSVDFKTSDGVLSPRWPQYAELKPAIHSSSKLGPTNDDQKDRSKETDKYDSNIETSNMPNIGGPTKDGPSKDQELGIEEENVTPRFASLDGSGKARAHSDGETHNCPSNHKDTAGSPVETKQAASSHSISLSGIESNSTAAPTPINTQQNPDKVDEQPLTMGAQPSH
ncbi:uncharacterized protein N7483_002018 [Penicillium malachiteum]|uniref:uncharacterized protein n=1 Tax=Penicillium malachiteum TaxID=1324776 RepID=UPI002546FCD8|nr:uncharacterized protein N7483_002018 [Penicillium malachiteum]KAJ5736893.1 hypothetical protein N7483_002018 [Penicillium malachiteum]